MNTINGKLKESVIIRLIDLYVIIVQISFHMTIIPYFIFDGFEPFNLVLLLNSFICVILYFIRFKKKLIFPKEILRKTPFVFLFILLFFQLLSGFSKMEIDYVGVAIVFSINFLVFIIYLKQLFLAKLRLTNDFNQAFFKFTSYYMYFGLFNVFLVLVSFFLTTIGLISKTSNDISDIFPQLFGNNVSVGAEYYWPGWLSITTQYSRLFSNIGTLSGWAHEPHVFCYLIFPSMFLFLAKYYNNNLVKYLILISYFLAALLSFSVTSFISILLVFSFNLILDRKFIIPLVLLLFAFYSSNYLNKNPVFNKLIETTERKISPNENTASLDYSTNRISYLINPDSIFGDGILLSSKTEITSGGFFTTVFYILFYVSIFIRIFKISIYNKEGLYVGLAFLYFTLHSFKLSSSVFAMPYTIYIITIMCIYELYRNKYKIKI
jgi:hypothetical protein